MKDAGKKVSKSIRILLDSSASHEFRTTGAPDIVDESDFEKIGKEVKGAKKHYLQQFRPQITLDPHFREIKPYSIQTLEKFKEILSEYVEEVDIRGI